MSTTYKLSVNQTYSFDLSESDLKNLDALPTDKSNYHVLKNNKSFKAEITHIDFINKKHTVSVNNNVYEVAISDALDMLIKNMGIEKGRTKVVNAIKAPMPGLILGINVEVGQEVKENDPLLILEAMKMENIFFHQETAKLNRLRYKKELRWSPRHTGPQLE